MTDDEKRAAVRGVIEGWLDSDGFQEGADGATSVASIVYGDDWVQEILKSKGYR